MATDGEKSEGNFAYEHAKQDLAHLSRQKAQPDLNFFRLKGFVFFSTKMQGALKMNGEMLHLHCSARFGVV